ncbi:hypothetical protein GCM10010276_14160 [Streptomyces longisporus]|uniref:Lipoprotein n=1 Tax=Streptomyces longisporus TaxID=1948 RepID=A0ABN3L7N2_STRLO
MRPDIVARVHRTTTTATLLVTVAVTALAGCVTIQRPPASGPPPAASPPSAPYPDDQGTEQIVQAPVHEALEGTAPSGRPERKPPERQGPPAAQPAAPHPAPHPHPRPRPRPPHPQPGHPGRPRVELPDVPRPVPKQTDVCALGRTYGGWRPDSPEAVICRQAYGH